jgi:hypothetical protein
MLVKPVLIAAFALPAVARDLSGGRWIYLTRAFNAQSVYWPTAKMFGKETVFEGHTPGG